MIRPAEWIFGLIQITEAQIECDHCRSAEPIRTAITARAWHVGVQAVTNLYGERVSRALHLCPDCTERDDESSPFFPGVSFFRVEVD